MKNIKMNKKVMTIIVIIVVAIVLAFLSSSSNEKKVKDNSNQNIEVESTVAVESTEESNKNSENEQIDKIDKDEKQTKNEDSETVEETAAVANVFKAEAEAEDYYDEIPYLITNEKGESYLANDFVQEIPEDAVEVDGHYEVNQKDGSVAIYEKTAKEYSITKLDTEDIYEPTEEKIILEYEGKQHDITQYVKEYYNGEPIIELEPVAEMIGWEFTDDDGIALEFKNFNKGVSYNADENVVLTESPEYFAITKDDKAILYYTNSKAYCFKQKNKMIECKSEYQPVKKGNNIYISILSLCLSENGPVFDITYSDSEIIYKID